MYLMDNAQRERELSREGMDKIVKDLFKAAAFFLALKGAKMISDRYF